MNDTDKTFTWAGNPLPLWTFEHFKDLEDFLDNLCPIQYVAGLRPELNALGATGIVFSKDPLIIDNAVAAFVITDPEPED